jgi:hypothetical protein
MHQKLLGVKVHFAFGYIDMRKGIGGLAMLVQGVLRQELFYGPSLRVSGLESQPHQNRVARALYDTRSDCERFT